MKNSSLNFIVIVVVVFFGVRCGQLKKDSGWDVVVSGKVGFPKDGSITIKSWTDTTENFQILDFDRTNYTYKSTVHVTEPGFYRINFFDKQYVDVILHKNDIEVNADGEENGFFEIVGSPEVEMYKKIQTIRSSFSSSPELLRLNSEFNVAVKNRDQELIEELRSKYQELLRVPNDSVAKVLVASSPSVGVIEFLSKGELDPDQYFSVYEQVVETLKEEWATYQIGKDFIEMVSKMKTVAVGATAPEIALPNPEGKVVALSSLRGKYVLVDFWAKWCVPCREENPNVVRVYKKYKGKGFEVFGVSLDRSKEDWTRAIAEDGLEWTQVSDLKYFQSEAASTYNIGGIPFSILLDPNGVIIAKNLRGSALESKLAEIFGPL